MDQPIRFRLNDMIEHAHLALRFQGNAGVAELEADDLTRLALLRAIEVVGEAASQVPQAFREIHADIPWRRAINMRNILIHAYRQIDLGIVTATVREDFPVLIADLERLLGHDDT